MSPIAAANESQFYFLTAKHAETTFDVMEFYGKEAVSFPYEFNVHLISDNNDISPDTILGQPATLFIYRNGQYYPYSGIVVEFELLDGDSQKCSYRAMLVASLWITRLNYRSRIFQNMTISEIIQSVLKEANIGNFSIDLSSGTKHEYIVQYQETDLNFISRLMEGAGIFYYFREPPKSGDQIKPGASCEQLIITDNPKFERIEEPSGIIYRPSDGMAKMSGREKFESVNTVRFSKSIIQSEVVVKSYNYRCPEVTIAGKQPISSGNYGTFYEYGGSYKTVDDAQKGAQLICKRLQTRQHRISGTGDCRGFRAGYSFELQEHKIARLCIPYIITEVIHSGGCGDNTYHNQFLAIPAEMASRFAPEKSASDPKVSGILSAQIEGNEEAYATIDDKGRYRVRLPFDLSSNSNNCNGSKQIRLAQPYCGSQYGFHFPSHQGTEMVLACVDGDPNKPVGIGTVPNANTISPVIAINKHENLIKTAGGNILAMDDTEDKQKIRLITKGLNGLEMNDEKKRVVLTSTDLNQLVLDDENSKVIIKGSSHTISMNYADGEKSIEIISGEGHIIKIDDKKKNIAIKTADGNQIEMDDNGKKVIIADSQGKNSITLDQKNGLILSGGKVTIDASQEIVLSGANIKINSNKGDVDLNASGDLKLNGTNINQKGNSGVKIEAAKFEAKGSISTNIAGSMMEMSADASVKIKGNAMVEVNGGGMAVVKGGVVMIN
ncbi:MAG: type VI secretion system tip protein VgrG [Fibrobacter sp.]|jgi:type VI secretion system secreted protein VgrG|nr:type VI secretion system tip protein VgrG [Fibrobacter sp.]